MQKLEPSLEGEVIAKILKLKHFLDEKARSK